MLTIFTIPKPFNGHIGLIQRNAICSWRRLGPSVRIILLGHDAGVAEAAREYGTEHEPDIALTEYGTPLVSDAFARARRLTAEGTLMFTNCDMIYFDDLLAAVAAVPFDQFMLCGRRWDLDVTEALSSGEAFSWEKLIKEYARRGKLHAPSALDFFIFPRAMDMAMPPLVVGRWGWDSWLMWNLRSRGIPVIDATGTITALHQNHDYTQLKFGASQYTGPEMLINYRLAGGYRNMLGLREADWVMPQGVVCRPPWPGRIFSLMGPTIPYRLALSVKRHCQKKIKALLNGQ